MQKQRVQKLIALAGLCSRRKAEELIEQGRVKVNNKIISLGDQYTEEDIITVDNKRIKISKEKFTYIILNKRKGFVTSKKDELGRKTIFDLIKEEDKRPNLFSVGRLDKQTGGLIIITNDGQFAQKIIHPSSKITKEYIADLDKELSDFDKKILEKGVKLEDFKLRPCTIRKIGEKRYVVELSEGRKRQIRRMFEKLNYEVVALKRIKIGNLDLKGLDLKPGDYKKVSKEFLEKKIFN